MFDVEVITDRRETIRAMLTPPVPEPGKPITLIDDEIGEQAAIETLVHIRYVLKNYYPALVCRIFRHANLK